ncbi:hypothetical protein M569_04705 [Genlisea aurea]|uniref:AMP-dependent synthetase/ligase domain-containing protein n=1 Tax=Genlisea aurea TaxID=192259 RepID=S8E2Z0_9LAMI|nr:hypothetical protein M569_04705 [Genlisea aurea]
MILSGENVEPSVIEEAAMRSSLIQQIVVIGQDQRRLGAIIVPNREEVSLEAKKLMSSSSSIQETEAVKKILREELRKWTWDCSFQVNGPVLVVEEAFTVDNGLMTPTMKVKRDQVSSLYRHQIEELYK